MRIDIFFFAFLLVALFGIGLMIGATISDGRNYDGYETAMRRIRAYKERLESQDQKIAELFLWVNDRKTFYKVMKDSGTDSGVKQFYTGCASAFYFILEKYTELFK